MWDRLSSLSSDRLESRSHTPGKLRIAAERGSPFAESVASAGHELLLLPDLADSHGSRSMEQRKEDGDVYSAFFAGNHVDLLLDVESSALTFVSDPNKGGQSLAMTHSQFGVPYVAHFVDPITDTMHKIDWATRWRLLEHPGWVKWIWDQAHAEELIRLGAANVLSLPMATVDADYPRAPLPEHPTGRPVGFLGHPATTWFQAPPVSPATMRIGMIAAAAKADTPAVKFHEVYYELYRFAEPPHAAESPMERATKAAAYFQAKFTYNVFLAVKQRDRFVLFLKERLGDQFELIGDYWWDCLGVSSKPAVRGHGALVEAYRDVAICLNLYKGNAETGLNQRHFEVTAAGGFLLTYAQAELEKHFEVGRECVVFHDERDLLDKIRYYLAHPQKRIEIALAGQRRALAEHLYSHRIQRLVAALKITVGQVFQPVIDRLESRSHTGA